MFGWFSRKPPVPKWSGDPRFRDRAATKPEMKRVLWQLEQDEKQLRRESSKQRRSYEKEARQRSRTKNPW